MANESKTNQERVSKKTLQDKLNKKRKESKPRSARYESVAKKIIDQPLSLAEAVDQVKETATTKFDSSVEIHIHLTPKKGKKGAEDEYARGIIKLPNGLGKARKIVILDEATIEELAKSQKVDFDVAIATPDLMPKLGKIAKLLGTKGKMPNPKAGTVTDDPAQVKAEIEAGRVEYRQDSCRNVHQMIGKASWESHKLIENAQTVINGFTRNRIASITLTTTMGPSVKIKPNL